MPVWLAHAFSQLGRLRQKAYEFAASLGESPYKDIIHIIQLCKKCVCMCVHVCVHTYIYSYPISLPDF